MRRLILCAALSLPLGAGHTAYWVWATRQLRVGFDHWVAQQVARGWVVQAGTPEIGGWPRAATLRVPTTLLQDRASGGLTWHAARIVLRVDLLSPTTLHVQAEGAQRLRLGDGPEIPFRANQLCVAFPLNPNAPAWLSIAVDGLQARISAGERGMLDFALGGFTARGDQHATNMALAVRANDVSLPTGLLPAFGGRIDTLAFDAILNGPVFGASTPAQGARRWRDAGGELTISTAHLSAGASAVTGEGHLTLDTQLQPAGSGTLRIAGHAALLAALAAANLLDQRVAGTLKTMLGLLARPGPAGGPATVDIPLALHDRTLSLHQFAVHRFPAVTWPVLAWPAP